MKRQDVKMRDPYVLVSGGHYYLYGTRSATCWGPADGFDCYVSKDLENWEGPIEVFHRPEGFWADRNYWAPECYELDGVFYLIATLAGEGIKKGVHVLKANSPTGPFTYSHRLTPEEWTCIDGSLYFPGEGNPWLLYSHSFEDDGCRDMCAQELKRDLSAPIGAPRTIFQVSEAPWAVPVPFAKEEFGMDGDIYFSDGPFVVPLSNGALALTWSSWGQRGYAVGVAVSDSGRITGPWRQQTETLFPGGGGHGMVFTALDGKRYYTLHVSDEKYQESPEFFEIMEQNGTLKLV